MFIKKIIKAVAWVGVGNVISRILSFILFIILAWLLDKESYGYIRWTLQIGIFLSNIAVLGFPPALTRYIGADKGNREKVESYITNTFFVVVFGVIILSFISLLIYNFKYEIIFILIGNSMVLLYLGIIKGLIDYKKVSIFNILRNIIKFILLSFIFFLPSLKSFFYIIFVYGFGGWIAIYILEVWKPLKLKIKLKYISFKILKKLFRFSIFSFISTISYSFIMSICYIFLSAKYNYVVVANFSVAVTLLVIYSFTPEAIGTILMPKIAGEKSKIKNIRFLKETIILTLLFSIIILIGVLFAGKWIIYILFGDKYIDSYPYLLVLSVGAIFAGLRNNFCAFWEGINKPEIASLDIFIGAIVTFITLYIFTPYLGPLGASWSYSVGFFSAFIVDVAIFLIKYHRPIKVSKLKIFIEDKH